VIATLLRHRITWGVAIAVGVLVAIAAHGALKYRDGFAAGVAAADAKHAQAALIAADVATRNDTAHAAETAALRDSLRTVTAAAARARTRSAVATARVETAIETVRADTAITRACDELATACELAALAWNAERDSLAHAIDTQQAALTLAEAHARAEAGRTQTAVVRGIVLDRATRRPPSRLRWLLTGAAIPLTWMVIR
jgi:hypothetical protein